MTCPVHIENLQPQCIRRFSSKPSYLTDTVTHFDKTSLYSENKGGELKAKQIWTGGKLIH